MIDNGEPTLTAPTYVVEHARCCVSTSPSTRSQKAVNAMDELSAMLVQEKTRYFTTFDYLAFPSSGVDCAVNNERVSEAWRRKICEWSFEVVDHFGFDREVVSIALSYLDRVVGIKTKSSGEPMHRRDFQLVAVTCLYLAIKLHGETDAFDGTRRKLKINAFVELSRNLFTVETLEAKEREILSLLEWKVNPPTTVRFVVTLIRLLPDDVAYDAFAGRSTASTLYELARYLTELAVCVSSFSFNYTSSEIAFASVLCAMDALPNNVRISYETRVELLTRITECTFLTPHSVESLRRQLVELCPSMFSSMQECGGLSRCESVGNNEGCESDGKASPVSVLTQCLQSESPRKRGRHQSS